MIETLVLLGHLIVAALIIALVLLQRGKGAEAGTGFGAGASGTVFGSRGSASFFSRATAVLAALFFATSLALAYFSTQSSAPEGLLGAAAGGGETQTAQQQPDESEQTPVVPASEVPSATAVASQADTADDDSTE
jgi:preprotein translocase subunit SecG